VRRDIVKRTGDLATIPIAARPTAVQCNPAAMRSRCQARPTIPSRHLTDAARFADHDEHQMFAALTRHRGFFGEMNVIPAFSTFRVTSHVSLREALGMITPERITAAIELADATLTRMLGRRPRIGVAALNPHAGENGLFGREEIEMIAPTLETIRARGIDCAGPIPSDVIFIRARDGGFDGMVSMYHDQGQIATKLLDFNQGVTVTAGLNVVFTTPAHGTAFDIAGKGVADPGAMRRALELAARLARRAA
jgi:4-hydroxythreonine-4-phosphate dehydrogenase